MIYTPSFTQFSEKFRKNNFEWKTWMNDTVNVEETRNKFNCVVTKLVRTQYGVEIGVAFWEFWEKVEVEIRTFGQKVITMMVRYEK